MPRTLARCVAPVVALLMLAGGNACQAQVVISEVYGGGGNASATFNRDFVELYNQGGATVSLAGFTLQYASTMGAFNNAVTLAGSISPGQFYVVALTAAGANGASVAADEAFTAPINLSATAGKVALANSGTTVASPASVNVLDFVGYGTAANQFEGTGPAPGPTNPTSIQRTNPLVDLNQNATEFQVLTPTPGFAPVPEPATVGLLAAAGLGLAGVARRRLAA